MLVWAYKAAIRALFYLRARDQGQRIFTVFGGITPPKSSQNELKIKNVAKAIFLNCLILNASKADINIPLVLFNTYLALMGKKSV